MPLAYRIDPMRRIVTITGDYADAEGWRAVLGAIETDPDYRRGSSFLRDLRASTHPVSAETVIEIIAVVREFWERLGAHRAAIVSQRGIDDPAVIAHALADGEHMPLRAFTNYDEAVSWLEQR